MTDKRVVITGMGALTPLGLTLDETRQGLLQARSGIGLITSFDASDLPVRVAGEIKGFDATHYIDRKQVRRTSRTTHLAIAAATTRTAPPAARSASPRPRPRRSRSRTTIASASSSARRPSAI